MKKKVTRNKSARILAVHRYFWPDSPPYASMLRAISEQWVSDGHKVDILTSMPSYRKESAQISVPGEEELSGVWVRRVRLIAERGGRWRKVVNIPLFIVKVAWHMVRRGPYDVVMCSTAPPVLLASIISRLASWSGARFIYHCMDIHPEIGRISGEFSHPVVFNLLQKLDRETCRRSASVVVLSPDMKTSLESRRPGASDQIDIINNFELPVYGAPNPAVIPPEISGLKKEPGRFRILFAGNIGRFQGLETVIDAVKTLTDLESLELIFLGDGHARETLEKRANDSLGKQIHFLGYHPPEVARQAISTADLCLVTLAPDIYRYAFPSKTMTFLARGRPILAVIESSADLTRLVQGENAGIVVESGNAAALAESIRRIVETPEKLVEMQVNAQRVADQQFTAETVLPKWSALLRRVLAGNDADASSTKYN